MSLRCFRPSRAALGLAVGTVLACSEHVLTPVEPVASPTPVPAPTPTPRISACGVGPGTGDGLESSCPRQTPSFLFQVNAAIDEVVLNDQYHIMISDGHIRRGDASYRATCYPAWF